MKTTVETVGENEVGGSIGDDLYLFLAEDALPFKHLPLYMLLKMAV